MEKLASNLEPLGSEFNAFSCCLFGSIEEVGSHLWQHQALWMRFLGDSGEERYDKVPFTELLEASADFSSGRYSKEVELEDDSFDGSGKVTVSINLEAVRDDAGATPNALRPSLMDAFVLRLEVFGKTSSLIAKAVRLAAAGAGGRSLYLRCAGVEQPLCDACTFTLVLVESWKEVALALLELDVCVQIPYESSRDFIELPLDFSDLISAAEGDGAGGGRVEAKVTSTNIPSLQEGLIFTASVQSFRWAGLGRVGEHKVVPGTTQEAELLTDRFKSDVRRWRVSIEIKSIRMISRSAKVFVGYSYAPLQQPRPFRTNPPALARQHATVFLPHAFAAYTLESTPQEIFARLEETLSLEVWQRDVYRKDDLIGVAELAVASVFDRPLQHSNRLPSMVHGFRVLDQVRDVVGTGNGADKLGVLRVLLFLEDLGQVPTTVALAPTLEPAAVGGAALGCPTQQMSVNSDPAGTTTLPSADLHPVDAAELALRQSPAYTAAYELELWKRSEEEKFRASLLAEERQQRERLQDEYDQREASRAKEFRQKQAELREVEGKVRSKLQDLQQREVAVVAAETRCAALQDEVKRRTDLAIQEYEDLSRRKVEDAQQALQLEKRRSRHLEGRVGELENDLTTLRQRLREVEEEVDERRRKLDQHPVVQLQHDLQLAQIELNEANSRSEALAASRDHFRNKVEELCRRMLANDAAAAQAAAFAANGNGGAAAAPQPALGAFAQQSPVAARGGQLVPGQGMPDVAHSLKKIQEDLGQLARDWTLPATNVPGVAAKLGSSPQTLSRSPSRPSFPHVPTAPASGSVAPQAQDHLVWLRSQRQELLESGLYSEGDPVLVALNERIMDATHSAAG